METNANRRLTLLAGLFSASAVLLLTVVMRETGTSPVAAGGILASLIEVF